MTIIYSLRISVRLKETSNAFPIMRKSTLVSVGSFINKEGKDVDVRKELLFIDCFKFMASSLDKLVSNLSLDKLKESKKVFKDKIKLVSRKGLYPYDYMDSIANCDETELPPKDKFYSKLNDCDISDEDYKHVENV